MQNQGREIEEKHGKLNLWNGDSSRLHVRKAQYKYISNLFVWHLADIAHAAMGGTGVSVDRRQTLIIENCSEISPFRTRLDDRRTMETHLTRDLQCKNH